MTLICCDNISVIWYAMVKMNYLIRVTILLVAFFWSAAVLPAESVLPASRKSPGHKNVLLLNSYHRNYQWSDSQVDSIVSVLQKECPAAELFIENMDIKRIGVSMSDTSIATFLKEKYQSGFFDLVIAVDNAALRLALKEHQRLFADVPIVFSGVNDFSPEMLDGHKNVTGQVFHYDFKKQIDLILRMFPETAQIYIIADNSDSAQALLRHAREDALVYERKGKTLSFEFLSGEKLTHQEMLDKLAALPADSAVILCSWLCDKNNQYIPLSESYTRLAKSSNAPVFCTMRQSIGVGPLGGYVISGTKQGVVAGLAAVNILRGHLPGANPIDIYPAYELIFDYNALQRWNAVDHAPHDSLFIGKPESMLRKYQMWFAAGGVLLLLQAGVIGLLIRNIFYRRNAVRARNAESQRLAMILKGLNIAIWEFDLDNNLFITGENFSALLGSTMTSGHFNDFIQMIHPDDRERIGAALNKFFIGETKAILDLEFRIKGHDDYIWVAMHGCVTGRNDIGRPQRVMGIGRNISNRKTVEEELKESEREKKLILNNVSECLVFIDGSRHIRWVNRAFIEDIRQEEVNILGKIICEMGYCRKECDDCPIRRSLADAQPQVIERLAANGRVKIVKSVPVIDEQGKMSGCVITISDITEQRQIEQKLVTARDEAETARMHAEQANQAKSDFLAGISHDVRTPLNGILGMAELLMPTPLTPEQQQYVNTISSTGNAMLRLLNNLLDLSRIEAGKLILENVVFNLREMLDETIAVMMPMARAKGLPIILDFDSHNTPTTVIGDATRLREVITNLVSNAVKYTEKGQVSIRVSAARGEIGNWSFTFSVTDTGMGMDAEQLRSAFDKYTIMSNPQRHRNCGTGLGLTICHQLVKLMGGELQANSTAEVGSEFFFTIPLQLTIPGTEPAITSELAITSEPADFSRLSILVAEDSKVNQMVITDFLSKHLGFNVAIAEDGSKVLELLDKDDHYDLILMDCQMPVMDGYAATAAIRSANKPYSKIKIVAMTADAMVGAREKCIEAGMDDYLAKPIRLNELRQMIDTVINHI